MGKCKTLLTFEDLVKFCEGQKFYKFSSAESGYKLAVKIPTTFEIDENVDENHCGMTKLKIKIFHDGLNRNGSHISREAADKAKNTIPDRPVLAAIHQLDSGEWDFEGHEMEITQDEDGNDELVYIEKQVGSFSSEPAFWEHDDVNDKDFVCAYAYISNEYTKTVDIIKRKGGTKNSCELSINEFTFNAKEKYLDLLDFYVSGSTLLGARDDGTQIGEGMLGSSASIADFSSDNNSIMDKVVVNEGAEPSSLNYKEYSGKEENGTKMNFNKELFENLLAKYLKTVEDVTFEYEELSDEDLEVKFEEVFGVIPESGTPSEPEKFTKTFEISHEDTRYALYQLLAAYEESDNDLYVIQSVFDDHFVYYGLFTDKYWGQKYTKENDNIALGGERWELFAELLTASEKANLESMRASYEETVNKYNELTTNFDEVSAKLAKYEAEPAKMEILNSTEYSQIADTEEFVAFKAQEAHFDLSVEDVRAKADSMLLAYAKQNKIEFSEDKQKVTMTKTINPKKKVTKRYGNLFNGI